MIKNSSTSCFEGIRDRSCFPIEFGGFSPFEESNLLTIEMEFSYDLNSQQRCNRRVPPLDVAIYCVYLEVKGFSTVGYGEQRLNRHASRELALMPANNTHSYIVASSIYSEIYDI